MDLAPILNTNLYLAGLVFLAEPAPCSAFSLPIIKAQQFWVLSCLQQNRSQMTSLQELSGRQRQGKIREQLSLGWSVGL